MNLLFALVMLIGTLIRLVHLDQSLWLDEAITANTAANLSYQQILTQFSPHDFHPPLYYFFQKFWITIFGNSEISLRLPSIIFSLLTALLIRQICLKKFNHSVAFWASTFFYLNPLIIYYSQEARSYSLVTMLFVLCLYALINRRIILLNLAFFLSLSVFYGSLYFVIPILIYLLLTKKFKTFILLLPSLLIFAAFFGRLLLDQLSNSRHLLQLVPNWSSVLGVLDFKNLALIPIKFSLGRISFYPKTLYWGIAAIWTAFVFIPVIFASTRNKFLFYFLVSPLLIGLLSVLITQGGLQYFRFIFLIPIITILLAIALHTRPVLAYFFASIFLIFSLTYLLLPQFHRENWKDLLSQLPPDSQVFMVASFSDPAKYYRPDLIIHDIRTLPLFSNSAFYVIPYGETIHNIDHTQYLQGLSKIKDISKNQVTLEYWSY